VNEIIGIFEDCKLKIAEVISKMETTRHKETPIIVYQTMASAYSDIARENPNDFHNNQNAYDLVTAMNVMRKLYPELIQEHYNKR
jgi:hypothetical protein